MGKKKTDGELHVALEIRIQGFAQEAAEVAVVLCRPLRPSADKKETHLRCDGDGEGGGGGVMGALSKWTHNTASAGCLPTRPGMPVLQTSARAMAPLMCPLSAAFT